LRARIQANEASAVASIHAINTAEISYFASFPTIGYAATLPYLGDGGSSPCPGSSTASCYLDSTLSSGTKSGYIFTYVADTSTTPAQHYTLNVDPVTRGVSGQRSFYSSDSNVTRANPSAAATSADAPLQ
jgi:type IV pilus assembly protein PilA